MSKEPVDYLRHILDECKFILNVTGNDFSKDDLLQDQTLKRALVRSLEIIGEARKYLLILK